MKIKPIGDRILVKPLPAEEKRGGLFIPDCAKETPTEFIVSHLGTGKLDEHGKMIPFQVKVGNRVLCSKYGGTEIKVNGETYKVLSSDDVIAVLED